MKKIVTILLMLVALTGRAQAPKGQVELFCGAEELHSSVNRVRYYDLLLNLTPGVKWHLGNDWQVAGQLWVPVINDGYLDRYSMLRLNMAVVSKELHWQSARQHVKLSAGLFNKERGGLDVKWQYPVNNWLMLAAQVSLTTDWALGFKTDGENEASFNRNEWRFLGIGKAHFWISKLQTEIRLAGGQYIEKDLGMEMDIMRHFKHVSVGLYAQIHEQSLTMHEKHKVVTNGYSPHRHAGGFKLVFMLPPYKSSQKKFVIRPSSNIQLNYNAQQDEKYMQRFSTDPEENERCYSIPVNWGIMSNK